MNLEYLFELFPQKRIAVIGDLMLDHYIWGSVDRISAEAPIPVVDVQKEEFRLGGAANVIHNLTSLGAKTDAYGVTGNDVYADKLNKLLNDINSNNFLFKDPDRPTTLKSRIVAAHQQIVRCDFEKRHFIDKNIEDSIINTLNDNIANYSAIILEDYNKGLLSENLIKQIIQLARINNIPITVDPKYKNFFEYKDVTVFKPNFLELQKNLGFEILNDTELHHAAELVFERINPMYLIVTRGEKGLLIFDKNLQITHIPTFAREVFDVSGAGDTVISTLTLCLACGCDIIESATIANHAAGSVCSKMGITPATLKDIKKSIDYTDLMNG